MLELEPGVPFKAASTWLTARTIKSKEGYYHALKTELLRPGAHRNNRNFKLVALSLLLKRSYMTGASDARGQTGAQPVLWRLVGHFTAFSGKTVMDANQKINCGKC